MDFDILLIIATFVVTMGASILSGMSGGGGGFIMTPFLIFVGLSPAQAVATSKFGGIGTAFGAFAAFRGKQLVSRRLVLPLIVITLIVSAIAAFTLPVLSSEIFQRIIAVLLIVLIPTLFLNIKAPHYSKRGPRGKGILYAIYSALGFLQALFGTGLATFVTLLLMFGFGLTALEANATKRVVQGVQSVVVGVLAAVQGLVFLWLAIAMMAGGIAGSYIGSKLAVKGGDNVVKVALAVFMLASGIVLFFTA